MPFLGSLFVVGSLAFFSFLAFLGALLPGAVFDVQPVIIGLASDQAEIRADQGLQFTRASLRNFKLAGFLRSKQEVVHNHILLCDVGKELQQCITEGLAIWDRRTQLSWGYVHTLHLRAGLVGSTGSTVALSDCLTVSDL